MTNNLDWDYAKIEALILGSDPIPDTLPDLQRQFIESHRVANRIVKSGSKAIPAAIGAMIASRRLYAIGSEILSRELGNYPAAEGDGALAVLLDTITTTASEDFDIRTFITQFSALDRWLKEAAASIVQRNIEEESNNQTAEVAKKLATAIPLPKYQFGRLQSINRKRSVVVVAARAEAIRVFNYCVAKFARESGANVLHFTDAKVTPQQQSLNLVRVASAGWAKALEVPTAESFIAKYVMVRMSSGLDLLVCDDFLALSGSVNSGRPLPVVVAENNRMLRNYLAVVGAGSVIGVLRTYPVPDTHFSLWNHISDFADVVEIDIGRSGTDYVVSVDAGNVQTTVSVSLDDYRNWCITTGEEA